jgi:hypothetical protein
MVDSYQTLIIDGPTLQGSADNNVPLLFISTNGALELKSGKITGNTNNGGDGGLRSGSGVRLDKGGVFTMSGGEISGNTCASTGGGVYMSGASSFTMSGGTISGNTANEGGGVAYSGSGYGKETYFTMTGGVIKGNTATRPTYPSGGGVHFMSYCIFSKTGGIIYGSDAPDADKNRVIDSTNGRLYRSRGSAVAQYVNNDVESVRNRYRETTLGENDNLSTKLSDPGWGI